MGWILLEGWMELLEGLLVLCIPVVSIVWTPASGGWLGRVKWERSLRFLRPYSGDNDGSEMISTSFSEYSSFGEVIWIWDVMNLHWKSDATCSVWLYYLPSANILISTIDAILLFSWWTRTLTWTVWLRTCQLNGSVLTWIIVELLLEWIAGLIADFMYTAFFYLNRVNTCI